MGAYVSPGDVHKILSKHLLADGLEIVCDLEKSRGSWIHDARSGQKFLDMFTCFAILPLGFNHPSLADPDFQKRLGRIAVNKISNSDLYTVEMAEALQAFDRYAIPDYLPHLFLISGGALAVENGLKAAFDWKVQKNFRKGHKRDKGHQVIHFRHAFHGRSGYTLSLTNTADPRKYQYFPKFDWPRIDPPEMRFPQNEQNLKSVKEAEERALAQIQKAALNDPDDVACLILEPILGEGGDKHFRPEFLKSLRRLADQHEFLLIFDEVQTGMGITGKMWAHEHWDVRPDLMVFGKKSQICGVMGGGRLDEVERNVFVEPSRINSTFGGSLVDLVRLGKILEVMHEEKLLDNAKVVGLHLLKRLQELEGDLDEVSNARGLGLMCAIDLPTPARRDEVKKECYRQGMIILPSGTHSIRFRPALTVTKNEIDQAVSILRESILKS
ncbi:MAG: L-lysine 6-transaminase [Deltaproteobacteria bacterium]|nr:L-lysine 6-transaminase [Deltaproteobacteria bacterium]